MRTLVTGFGSFGQVIDNPSAWLAEGSGRPFKVLEVAYEEADRFVEELDPESFDAWLMLGVAVGRPRICIETRGRNQKSGKDVREFTASGQIDPEQPEAIAASLWHPELVEELCAQYPDEIVPSDDAGSFLCNYLTFLGLRRFPDKRVGFLHVVSPETIALERQAEIVSAVLARLEGV